MTETGNHKVQVLKIILLPIFPRSSVTQWIKTHQDYLCDTIQDIILRGKLPGSTEIF